MTKTNQQKSAKYYEIEFRRREALAKEKISNWVLETGIMTYGENGEILITQKGIKHFIKLFKSIKAYK